jgi:hypothetical protein
MVRNTIVCTSYSDRSVRPSYRDIVQEFIAYQECLYYTRVLVRLRRITTPGHGAAAGRDTPVRIRRAAVTSPKIKLTAIVLAQ